MPWSLPPMVARPTDSTITFNMRNRSEVDVRVDIGTHPLNLRQGILVSDAARDSMIEETITGLLPNTEYYYKVLYRKASDTDFEDYVVYKARDTDTGTYSFHTARTEGETFVFTVTTDEHGINEMKYTDLPFYALGESKIETIYSNIVDDNSDFHFSLGDLVNQNGWMANVLFDSTYEMTELANEYMRQRIKHLSVQVPFFYCIGNREHEEGWKYGDADSLHAYAVRSRLKVWPNPQVGGDFYTGDTTQTIYGRREGYYAWTWGDVLFVVLDDYGYTTVNPQDEPEAWEWTLGTDQYSWLFDTLSNSDATWKFVFTHQLMSSSMSLGSRAYGRGGAECAKYSVYGKGSYEWGGEDSSGVNQYSVKRSTWTHGPIHDFLDSLGVQIVFKGHDHGYVYQDQLAPVHYLTIPKTTQASSGYALANDNEYPDTENNVKKYCTGHVRVTVYGSDSTKVEYVRGVVPEETPLVEDEVTINNKDVAHSFTITP